LSDTAIQTASETTQPTPTPTPAPEVEGHPGSLISAPEPGEAAEAAEATAVEPPDPFDAEKLTLPEGFSRDDALFEEFTNFAKESGLSASKAQSLIDLNARQLGAVVRKQTADWIKQNETWQAEIKSDPVFGGDKLPETLNTIKQVLADPALGHPGFFEAMLFTGAGNHPAVIKTVAALCKELAEVRNAVRGNVPGAGGQPLSLAQRMYSDSPRGGNSRME
jgi:hypothetical protein